MFISIFTLLFLGGESQAKATQSIEIKKEANLTSTLPSSRIRAHVLRLKPGQNLLDEIRKFAKAKKIKAGSILSAVGSLTQVTLRFANQPTGTSREGHFEIVSLVGTLNEDSLHLHAAVSDSTGTTVGGHLTGENRIYTTLELSIAEYEDYQFNREKDPTFGYDELVIKPMNSKL
jgi:predicted DNA-binding protein with PD1-like motif